MPVQIVIGNLDMNVQFINTLMMAVDCVINHLKIEFIVMLIMVRNFHCMTLHHHVLILHRYLHLHLPKNKDKAL